MPPCPDNTVICTYLKGAPDADAKDAESAEDDHGLHDPVLDGTGHLVHEEPTPVLLRESGRDPVAVHDTGDESVTATLERREVFSDSCHFTFPLVSHM